MLGTTAVLGPHFLRLWLHEPWIDNSVTILLILLPAYYVALLATPGAPTLRRGAANAWYWFSIMGFTFFILVAWVYWSGLELGVPPRLHAHLHRIG